MNAENLLSFTLLLSLTAPSAAAQGLGLVQPESTYSTSSAWLNTSVRVFDPSSRSPQISLRSANTTSYNVSASSLDTGSMSPESRYYVSGSYAQVYSLPVHIRIDRQKTRYSIDLELKSRPTASAEGPIPVVTRPLDFELQYNGPLQSQDAPSTGLQFEPQSNRTLDPSPANDSNTADRERYQTSEQPRENASTDVETRTDGSPSPILLLFIAATACYILWKI